MGDLWITGLAPMPPPLRCRPSGGTLDSIIYVVGGARHEECPGNALDTVQAYNPATDRWSDKLPMPTPRTQVGLGADSVNQLLYAIGGATRRPDYMALDTVEVYDPAGNKGHGSWTPKQHLNTARGLPAVAAVNGKIYAIGGQTGQRRDRHGRRIRSLMNSWTTKPSMMPHPRLNSAAAVVDDKIYIMGGKADILFRRLMFMIPPAISGLRELPCQRPAASWRRGRWSTMMLICTRSAAGAGRDGRSAFHLSNHSDK